jgi:hypothetical protein
MEESRWARLPAELMSRVLDTVHADDDPLAASSGSAVRLTCSEWRAAHDTWLTTLAPCLADESTLPQLLGRFSNLTTLRLLRCEGVTDQALQTALTAHPTLRRLTALDLTDSYALTDDSVTVLSQLPALTSLVVTQCGRLTDNSIVHVVKARADTLTQLDVSYCRLLTDTSLLAVGQCKHLTALHAAMCPKLTSVGLAALQQLPALAALTLSYCGRVNDAACMVLAALPALTRCAMCHPFPAFALSPMLLEPPQRTGTCSVANA